MLDPRGQLRVLRRRRRSADRAARQKDHGASSLGELRDQIEAGQSRVLAVSSNERVEGIDAPTLSEAGIDLTFTNWRDPCPAGHFR